MLKNLFFILLTFSLLSCQSEKDKGKIIKNALHELTKEKITENDLEFFFEFPFCDDGKTYLNSSKLLDWQKSNLEFLQKTIKIQDVKIINVYSHKNIYEKKELKDDLKRLLKLKKNDDWEAFEVVLNEYDYIENESSLLIFYDTNTKKIFGWHE